MNRIYLVGSGESLTKHVDNLNNSVYPKFCINNSLKLVKPDYWFGGDVYIKHLFPDWLWKHECKKYLPNPKGEILQYIGKADERALAYLEHVKNKEYINIGYYYDKETFLSSEQIQIGYASRHNIHLLVNNIMTFCSSSSMLPPLRLCYDLGFKEIVLVGVDLHWKESFYAYQKLTMVGHLKQLEDDRFNFLMNMLVELIPVYKEHGCEIKVVDDDNFLAKHTNTTCII